MPVYVFVWAHICYGLCVEVQGLAGVSSLYVVGSKDQSQVVSQVLSPVGKFCDTFVARANVIW